MWKVSKFQIAAVLSIDCEAEQTVVSNVVVVMMLVLVLVVAVESFPSQITAVISIDCEADRTSQITPVLSIDCEVAVLHPANHEGSYQGVGIVKLNRVISFRCCDDVGVGC